MQQEAPEELLAGQGHCLLLIIVRIILPAKGHFAVGRIELAVIGDGDAVRIARQIMQDVLRPAEWWLGVDNPILPEQRPEKGAKAFLCADRLWITGEQELPAAEGTFPIRR
jgi:hypothetical protein